MFVDIYEDTYNINPDGIEDAIKLSKDKGLNPRAIIPVDLFGLPARYRMINQIAKKYNMVVIEDAAQGFGGVIKGKRAGSFEMSPRPVSSQQTLGCYGDGGAIFTNDEELALKMRS